MNQIKTTEFFDKEFVNYASYATLRMIASCIDGFKNTPRKIAYTALDKNINKPLKTSQFSAKMSEHAEYLHGDAAPVIIGMAQNFAGTNNMPLLDREGNFGNRFIPEASAPRYIYTNGSKEFFALFSKEDNNILTPQYFEGTKIEPLFYVPSLPLLLINGNEGVATGFAQKILPRKPELIIHYLKNRLKGIKSRIDAFRPHYNGFNGVIEQGDNDKQWLIKGSIKKVSITKIEITEVPVGYSLKDYIKVLDTLEEKGIIKSYKDNSENDIFNFVVSVPTAFTSQTDEEILDTLKLVKKVTENFTSLNEANKVIQFQSASEIFEYYYNFKLSYVDKRKQYLVEALTKDMKLNVSKYVFIKSIIDGLVVVNNKSKDQIIKQIETIDKIIATDDSYDYLLRMPLYSLTKEKLSELKDTIKALKEKIEILKSKTPEELWLEDLEKLEKVM